jgi:hypothetical protein
MFSHSVIQAYGVEASEEDYIIRGENLILTGTTTFYSRLDPTGFCWKLDSRHPRIFPDLPAVSRAVITIRVGTRENANIWIQQNTSYSLIPVQQC